MELIATILLSLLLSSPTLQGYWFEVMGHINCVGAKNETHILREDCDITTCSFDDRYLLFLQCGNDIYCVQFGHAGECPNPTNVE